MSDVDVWGARARENLELPPHGWLDVEWLLQSRVWPKLFGSVPAGWWAPEVFQNLGVPSGGKWLSLGCGAGHAEIALARYGSVDEVLGLDPSAGAISVATELAVAAGVADKATFAISAMDLPEFEPNSVDVVHMNMSLHHIHDLEWVFAQIFTALRPGGYFVANEFVGPRRFQWSDARLKSVTDFLASMPDRLRRDYRDNAVKTQQETHPVEWWIAYDPTESVRSDDIIPVLKTIVPDLEIRPYGGNIANLVLENIIHNFDPNEPEDRAWMDKLWAADDNSVAAEGSDFVYIVASKSDDWREMATAWELAAKWLARREREGQDAAKTIGNQIANGILEMSHGVARSGEGLATLNAAVTQTDQHHKTFAATQQQAQAGLSQAPSQIELHMAENTHLLAEVARLKSERAAADKRMETALAEREAALVGLDRQMSHLAQLKSELATILADLDQTRLERDQLRSDQGLLRAWAVSDRAAVVNSLSWRLTRVLRRLGIDRPNRPPRPSLLD